MWRAHSIKQHPGQLAGLMTISVLLGAASAVLFTPRRGNEVRGKIRHRFNRARHVAKQEFHETADKFSNTMENAKERAKGTGRKLKSDAKATNAEMLEAEIDATKSAKKITGEIRRPHEP